MKLKTLSEAIFTLTILSLCTNGQEPGIITVAEITLNIRGTEDCFAAGDEIVFNFEEINGKGLTEVEIKGEMEN